MWLLIHKSGKTYLAPDRATFNTEFGVVELKEGPTTSSIGEQFLVTKPSFVDLWMRIKRGPQIAHWKDLGLIVALTGVGPGWRVLEVGGGSGFSTLFWWHIVGKEGTVVTYERNPRHLKILLENLERLGASNVTVIPSDPHEEPPQGEFDLVFLDIPEPWSVLDVINDHLREGGFLVAYLPTVEQVKQLENSLGNSFTEPSVHEVIYREWKLGGRTRPLSSGILHTAFVVLSRKIK